MTLLDEVKPSARRWRTLVRMERYGDQLLVVIPGWSPRLALIADRDGTPWWIPEKIARRARVKGRTWAHARLCIGAESLADLGLHDEDACAWEVEP